MKNDLKTLFKLLLKGSVGFFSVSFSFYYLFCVLLDQPVRLFGGYSYGIKGFILCLVAIPFSAVITTAVLWANLSLGVILTGWAMRFGAKWTSKIFKMRKSE